MSARPLYPANWPRCPKCGDHALDGHITCGKAECREGETRREIEREKNAIHDALYGFDDYGWR